MYQNKIYIQGNCEPKGSFQLFAAYKPQVALSMIKVLHN